MRTSLKTILLFAAALPVLAQQPCESLTKLALPDVVIQSAVAVPAGDFRLPTGAQNAPTVKVPAFCRVVGIVKPEVQFELWLPAQWNRKYMAVGNGGMAGAVPVAAMVDPLSRGYAVGSTDTGHVSGNDDGTWALARP